jgi:MoxR-like ATPase
MRRPLEEIIPVVSPQAIRDGRQQCRQIFVHPVIEDYMLDLVAATRTLPDLALGASPRGTLALYYASQALAAIRGRDYVLPDDVKQLAVPLLAHRLIVEPDAQLHGRTSQDIVLELLATISVPVEETWSTRRDG